MRRRGPPPKPTALKRLAGNPGHRPLNKNELRFPAGVPPCPECVLKDKIALAEWKRVVPELLRMGVLSEIFGAALAAYCMSYSHWQQAEEILRRDGRNLHHEQRNDLHAPSGGHSQASNGSNANLGERVWDDSSF